MSIIEILIWIASIVLAYLVGSYAQVLKYQKDIKERRKSILNLKDANNNVP